MHHIVIKNTARVSDVIFFSFFVSFLADWKTMHPGRWALLVCLVRESDNRISLLAPLINGSFRYAAETVDAEGGGILQMFCVFFFLFFFPFTRKAIYSSLANAVFFAINPSVPVPYLTGSRTKFLSV